MAEKFKISLTPYEARVVWGIIDGAMDAGACEGGLHPEESEALNGVMTALLRQHAKWKGAKAPEGDDESL